MNIEGCADQMNDSGMGSGCAHLPIQTPLFFVFHQQEGDTSLQPKGSGSGGEAEVLDFNESGKNHIHREKVCIRCNHSGHNFFSPAINNTSGMLGMQKRRLIKNENLEALKTNFTEAVRRKYKEVILAP